MSDAAIPPEIKLLQVAATRDDACSASPNFLTALLRSPWRSALPANPPALACEKACELSKTRTVAIRQDTDFCRNIGSL